MKTKDNKKKESKNLINKPIINENSIELQILITIQELLRWTKISSYKHVKNMLESILDSEKKKIVYFLSDGKNNQDKIIAKGNVGAGSVFRYWREWEKLGIGDSIPVGRGWRFKAAFDLNDFGLLPKSMQTMEKNNV